MKADLHLHSVYSDGLYTPDTICALAKSRGLSLLSITDHDTLLGQEDKIAAAKRHGLYYLSGWEISAYEGETKVHILGYGCVKGESYEKFTKERAIAAFARAEESVKKFNAHGVPVTMDEVLQMRRRDDVPVHTMHVARAAAVHLGLPDGDVYETWLARGKPANVRFGRPTPLQAIECIHQSGGVAAVAHPGRIRMGTEDVGTLIRRLKDNGLDGIEAHYTTHTERETQAFCCLATELSLFISGGSDMHVEDGVRAVGSPDYYLSDGLRGKVTLYVP